MLVQFRCSLFGDFQHRAFFDFGGDGPDKRPHGLGGPALFADNFANVHFSDFAARWTYTARPFPSRIRGPVDSPAPVQWFQ